MNNLLRSLGYFLLVPTAWGAYQAVKKPKKGEKVIYGSVAAVSFLLFMRSQALRKDELLNVPDVEIPEPSAVDQQFIEGMEINLWNALQVSFTAYNTRCRILKELYALDDSNFIAVINLYKNRRGTTLRITLHALWWDGCRLFDDPDKDILNRMNSLNIP